MKNNLGSILAKRALLSPEAEAYVEGADTTKRYTYRELNQRCNQIANAYLDAGIRKGDRVAFLLMNSIEFMESYFALAKIGAVVVPLNWRLVPDELEFILEDSGATRLIFDDELPTKAQHKIYLNSIPESQFILRLESKEKYFQTKIIKRKK